MPSANAAILATSIKLLMKGFDFLAVHFTKKKIGGSSSFELFLKKKPGVARVYLGIAGYTQKQTGFCRDENRTRLQNGSTRLLC